MDAPSGGEAAVWLSKQAFEQMALGHVAMMAARRDPARALAASAALRKRFKGTDQMKAPSIQVHPQEPKHSSTWIRTACNFTDAFICNF